MTKEHERRTTIEVTAWKVKNCGAIYMKFSVSNFRASQWRLLLLVFFFCACGFPSRADFTILHSFTHDEGTLPQGLALASDGSLYGITYTGGAHNTGTLYKVSPSGVFRLLHTFSDNNTNRPNLDGAFPSSIVINPDGVLYGTTGGGGLFHSGVLYSLSPDGEFRVLRDFNPNDTEASPGSLALGKDGSLYGAVGGSDNSGAVCTISPNGTYRTLHFFPVRDSQGKNDEGANPVSLAVAADGSVSGACSEGGAYGRGTLFKISPEGDFRLLHTFSEPDSHFENADGINPVSVTMSTDGTLYGATQLSGANHSGALFRVTSDGTFRVQHAFEHDVSVGLGGAPGGKAPLAVAAGANDSVYGIAFEGGSDGVGTLFKLEASGVFHVLHSFVPSEGRGPRNMVLGQNGTVFGATSSGGTNEKGTIFRFTEPLQSLTLSRTQVYGGETSTATVTLYAPAPAGGVVIALSSNTGYAHVRTSVTIPAGQISQSFPMVSKPVAATKAATVTACYDNVTKTASLLIFAPDLKSLTLSPTTMRGGKQNSTGTVTLTSPSPSGGTVVSLSSNTGYALVPASVTVASGSRTATFTVTTKPVTLNKGATITAAQGGVSKSVGILLTP